MTVNKLDGMFRTRIRSIGFTTIVALLCMVSLKVVAQTDNDTKPMVDAQDASQREAFFENRIRPLLEKHCIQCHGAKKSESSLRLDSRKAILRGGDRGPAVDLKNVNQSLVLVAINGNDDLAMPPDQSLAKTDVEAIRKWISEGLVFPARIGNQSAIRSGPITDSERRHWAY